MPEKDRLTTERASLSKGYVQIYTGDGKGKTTAALGLGLRAVGRGLKVIMYQFLKGNYSGELAAVKSLRPGFEIHRLAATEKFLWQLTVQEKADLKNTVGLEFSLMKKSLQEGSYDVVVLDEIMAVVNNGLLNLEEVCTLIDEKPFHVELILTGRSAPVPLLERAELVTEMRAVKHYFKQGVEARLGIEK